MFIWNALDARFGPRICVRGVSAKSRSRLFARCEDRRRQVAFSALREPPGMHSRCRSESSSGFKLPPTASYPSPMFTRGMSILGRSIQPPRAWCWRNNEATIQMIKTAVMHSPFMERVRRGLRICQGSGRSRFARR
jgi:hypothetical protein